MPRKKPIDELMKSRNMKALSPNLPEDLAISFYIQGQKLIFAAYQLTNVQGKYSLKQQTNKQTTTKFFSFRYDEIRFMAGRLFCRVAERSAGVFHNFPPTMSTTKG